MGGMTRFRNRPVSEEPIIRPPSDCQMRESLRNIVESDYLVNNIQEDDFNYAIWLIKDFTAVRTQTLKQKEETIRQHDPECAEDIIDDIAYYTHVDKDYPWHFCL